MKKGLPIIILVVLVGGVGAWYFLGRGKGVAPLPGKPGQIQKEAGEGAESFTGKLKQAVAMGVPMKCTYSQGGFSGTGFVKGRNYYGEISGQGQKGYVIIKDNCMWTWSDQQPQGITMCSEDDLFEEPEPGDMPTGQSQLPVEAEYHCAPAVFTDSKFDPPANIEFMDFNELGTFGGQQEP